MVARIESLPMRLQRQFNLVSLGGKAVGAMLDDERRYELRTIKQIILELGRDERIEAESGSRWERIAHDLVYFTRHEALNSDLKKIYGKAPTLDEVATFLAELEIENRVVLSRGCPARPNDKRLDKLITLTVYEGDDIVEQIHVSPKLKRDRRISRKRGAINNLQRFGLYPDQRLRDVVSGEEVDVEQLRDVMPSSKSEKIHVGDRLVYLSRYILNLVRGVGFVNKMKPGEWAPDITFKEREYFQAFLYHIPEYLQRGVIGETDLTEFRLRTMASFLMNPKLFINLVVDLDMHAIFPFFDDIVRNSQIYEDFSMPRDVEQEVELVKEIMVDRYDDRMSLLGNVAKMFGVGQRSWDEVGLM